ncbi:hypothetical protein AB0I28_28375 [Phytomonospora sp. NPDC050363]|uniref:hypothetical protein n=1 Tax=Phytomonospora sp. NPDC050363 TaxID=3155642 RepID=UPI0033F5D863
MRAVKGPGLADRVLTALGRARALYGGGRLLAALDADVRSSADPSLFDRRSAWYTLLDGRSGADPVEDRQIRLARGIVDACYNEIVAASLGASGSETELPDRETALAVARPGSGHTVGARATNLVEEPGFGEWLTWSRVDAIMGRMRHLTLPQSRYRYLVGRYRKHVVPQRAEEMTGRRQLWAHITAAPANMVGTVGGRRRARHRRAAARSGTAGGTGAHRCRLRGPVPDPAARRGALSRRDPGHLHP